MKADSFAGPIERLMTEDQARLSALLLQAESEPAGDAFDAFRRALLRHVAIEEKALLPYARERRFGDPWPVDAQLRSDHAALIKLVSTPPTALTFDKLRDLLALHGALEEGPSGLYAACDSLAGRDVELVLQWINGIAEGSIAPAKDATSVHPTL